MSDVTPLIRDLVRSCFGTAAAIRRLAPLAGDASTRRYVRLWLAGAGAPATAVAMLLSDRGISMSSEELAVFAEAPGELPYLNVHRFLEAVGVAVPRLYMDAADQGVLLLEDIGETALWDAVCQPGADVASLYRRAIEQLLRLQIEGTRRHDPSCIAFQQAFDERLFLWEFEHFIEYGIERSLGRSIPGGDAEALRAQFARIARCLDAQPRVLNHRDFHSWNLFVQNGAIRVIDFQDALLAPAPYDLATLLGDRDTPQVVGRQMEQELVQYYARRWWQLSGSPLADVEHVYRLCAVQKAFKVVGRFHFLASVKEKRGYLRYLPSTVRQIYRLLPLLPECTELQALLPRYLPPGS